MSDHDDFLAAIRAADPDDETPTLIYADWLEERGDLARAEFIRTQVELERPDSYRDQDRRRGLLSREADLLTRHEKEWRRPLAEISAAAVRGRLPKVRWGAFHRGLVRSVIFEMSEQGQVAAPPDFARIALETAATDFVFHTAAGLTDFLQSESRAQATGVKVSGIHYPIEAREHVYKTLAAAGGLSSLTSLELCSQGIGDEGLALFRSSPWFGSLRFLGLRANRLTADGLAALPDPGRLEHLGLEFNVFAGDGVRQLAERGFLRPLRSLNLSHLNLDGADAELIARELEPGRLRLLNLRSTQIGDRGLIALIRAGALRGVVELDVNFARITKAGVRELIRSPDLPAWVRLYIGLNDVDERMERELRERFGDEVKARSVVFTA